MNMIQSGVYLSLYQHSSKVEFSIFFFIEEEAHKGESTTRANESHPVTPQQHKSIFSLFISTTILNLSLVIQQSICFLFVLMPYNQEQSVYTEGVTRLSVYVHLRSVHHIGEGEY